MKNTDVWSEAAEAYQELTAALDGVGLTGEEIKQIAKVIEGLPRKASFAIILTSTGAARYTGSVHVVHDDDNFAKCA